jgi:hypothetical protein
MNERLAQICTLSFTEHFSGLCDGGNIEDESRNSAFPVDCTSALSPSNPNLPEQPHHKATDRNIIPSRNSNSPS